MTEKIRLALYLDMDVVTKLRAKKNKDMVPVTAYINRVLRQNLGIWCRQHREILPAQGIPKTPGGVWYEDRYTRPEI